MTLSWLDIFIIGCVVISMNYITSNDICNKIYQMFEDNNRKSKEADKESEGKG